MTLSWQHGYYSDTSYTYGFYKEFAPNWLDWVALLKGSEPPDTSARMLELGCGQGLGLCVMAAANPHMRFVGVDFNPEQIAHARSLVRRTGLTNIEFHEADFVSLAEQEQKIGPCDYVVAHGILTWVNQEVRSAIYRIIDQVLTPGGLAYFSYNALPGWLATHPVQHLMTRFADRTGVNKQSFQSALAALDQLKEAGAAVFKTQPGIQSRMDQLKKTAADNENYIYHEYFHTTWTLFYFTQIAEEAAQGKLRFLGSATLPENYDALLPESMRKVLDTAPDQNMRELFKDLAVNQSFRRDVFVRGMTPVWTGEQMQRFAGRWVTLVQAPDQVDLKFKTGFGEVTGKEEVYRPIVDQIAKGPLKIADLHKAVPGMNMGSLLQSLTLLAHGGAVGFYVPDADSGPAVAFNQALAERVACGAPYRYMALPGIGSGISLDEIQWMAVDAYAKGEAVPAGVAKRLKALNKSLVRDGQAVAQGDATVRELETRLGPFVEKTLPMIRRLGGVE
jgi:SAM-dependent methyltransferase